MICRVEVDGTRETTRVKKTICIVDITQVGCSTLCHQQYLDMIGVIRNKKSMMIKVTGYNYLPCQTAALSGCWAGGWYRWLFCPDWPESSRPPPHLWPWSCPDQRLAHHRTWWQGWSEPLRLGITSFFDLQRYPFLLDLVFQLLYLYIWSIQTRQEKELNYLFCMYLPPEWFHPPSDISSSWVCSCPSWPVPGMWDAPWRWVFQWRDHPAGHRQILMSNCWDWQPCYWPVSHLIPGTSNMIFINRHSYFC